MFFEDIKDALEDYEIIDVETHCPETAGSSTDIFIEVSRLDKIVCGAGS